MGVGGSPTLLVDGVHDSVVVHRCQLRREDVKREESDREVEEEEEVGRGGGEGGKEKGRRVSLSDLQRKV